MSEGGPSPTTPQSQPYHIHRPVLSSLSSHRGLNGQRVYLPWTVYTEIRTKMVSAALKPFSQWTPRHTLRCFPIPPTTFYSIPVHEKLLALPPIPINDQSGNYNYTQGNYASALIQQEQNLIESSNTHSLHKLPHDFNSEIGRAHV